MFRTARQELRYGGLSWSFCLDANGGADAPGAPHRAVWWTCHAQNGTQLWQRDARGRLVAMGKCLTAHEARLAVMAPCDDRPEQVWGFHTET